MSGGEIPTNFWAGQLICGVDEAGRGPLAGAVVAAAVILDPARTISGLQDSKKLSPSRREALALEIRAHALAFAVGQASHHEIDELNILQASMLAMRRAVLALNPQPDLARIDGNRAPDIPMATETLIGGDGRDASIAAASILAKTVRDQQMLDLHKRYPVYGFDRHKGYPTAEHRRLLAEHGPCESHRRSFSPVALAWSLHGGGARER